jgi:ketosteroid isomerase-like protein
MFKLASILLFSTAASLSYASEPKEALAAFHAALAAGDKAKATELLAPDVTIYESGYVERSRAEYAGHHLPEDITFAKTSTRSVLQQGERVEGSLAVIWQETETKARIGGKDVHILGTETALLQKNGDSWSIVHVHWSSRKPK